MHNGLGESVKFAAVEHLDNGCSLDACREIGNIKVDDGEKCDRLKLTPSEGLLPCIV